MLRRGSDSTFGVHETSLVWGLGSFFVSGIVGCLGLRVFSSKIPWIRLVRFFCFHRSFPISGVFGRSSPFRRYPVREYPVYFIPADTKPKIIRNLILYSTLHCIVPY